MKEGRACPGYLQCGDNPKYFGPGGRWRKERRWPKLKIEEPFGRISLARGITYVRTWMPGAHYFKRQWNRDCGAFHSCGVRRDRMDVLNWPLYEPHVARSGVAGRQYPAGRHWAAGRLVYRPDLHSDHYADAAVHRVNIRHGPAGLEGIDPGIDSVVDFELQCPYVLTALEMSFKWNGRAGLGHAVSIDGGKMWMELDGKVDDLALVAHFQLNPYALPYLVPGENVVSIEGEPFGAPLTVQWQYAEGPDWKETRTVSRKLHKPGQFTIDVKGAKYPRNVSLALSVAP